MSSLPWPACVPNGVPGVTTAPVNDSPIGQKQFATSTPLIFPARTHAKLKQLANVFIAEAGQKFGGAALFFLPWFQLFISCGICAMGEYSDHMPSSPTSIPLTVVGAVQLPGPNGLPIFPPLTSAIDGPGNIGQMHWASGKDAVPSAAQPGTPASHLTLIVPLVGVQIEAAQRAKSPGQVRKRSTRPCDMTGGTARRIAPIRDERTEAYRNMCFSLLSLYSEIEPILSVYPIADKRSYRFKRGCPAVSLLAPRRIAFIPKAWKQSSS